MTDLQSQLDNQHDEIEQRADVRHEKIMTLVDDRWQSQPDVIEAIDNEIDVISTLAMKLYAGVMSFEDFAIAVKETITASIERAVETDFID